MASPYLPTVLAQPALNPASGSSGVPPLPYLSLSEYLYAPTAMAINTLKPGGTQADQYQVLADTINRASRWADLLCLGTDPSAKGSALAASLSVESAYVRVKEGQLRLVCDYKPVLELVGCDVGPDPSSVSSIGAFAASAQFGRRVITVPFLGFPFRSGDGPPAQVPPMTWASYGRIYVVWSYVAGYPHTSLAANVAAGATSVEVLSTDGNGGLWGVYPASGSFPGTRLRIYDGVASEDVYVLGVTPGTTTTTLTTTPLVNAHTVPANPDFLPVSALPQDIHQAVISLVTALIKLRGARAMEMPAIGRVPSRQALAQAGALEDWKIADMILQPYKVRLKGHR